MPLQLLYTVPGTGGIALVGVGLPKLDGESEADWLARVAPLVVPAGAVWRVVDALALPQDGSDPLTWVDTGAAVAVDLTRATNFVSAALTARRGDAKAKAAGADGLGEVLRAVLLVAVDAINTLRQRLRDQDAAVAAAVSLADLKSRWASVATNDPVPDVTAALAKAAIATKIDGGGAD